jgi:hypothetical protein
MPFGACCPTGDAGVATEANLIGTPGLKTMVQHLTEAWAEDRRIGAEYSELSGRVHHHYIRLGPNLNVSDEAEAEWVS